MEDKKKEFIYVIIKTAEWMQKLYELPFKERETTLLPATLSQ